MTLGETKVADYTFLPIATPTMVRVLGGASPTNFIAMILAVSGSVRNTIDTISGSK